LSACECATCIVERSAVLGAKAVVARVKNITEAKYAVRINGSAPRMSSSFPSMPSVGAPGDPAVADDHGE
jgi:hypothetical protein